jgi:hypothetical protein
MRIISLASFWCTTRNVSQLFKLTIVLPQRIEELPFQVGDTRSEVVMLLGEEDTQRMPNLMFG